MKNNKFNLLLGFFLLSIIVSMMTNGNNKENKTDTMNLFGEKIGNSLSDSSGVLVMELFTPIFYTEGSYGVGGIKALIAKLDEASKNETVRGLILRVNSPGGSFGASEELYEAMMRFKKTGKPIVSSVIDICASGAYYAVLPSDLIIANRGAIIGSIGVRITSPDLTELYKKVGIGFNQITSVKYKDILSESRKMRAEEREHLEKMVKSSHEIFVGDVIRWREAKSSEATLRQAANGLVYSSADAKELGLIDQLGGMDMAKTEMANLLDEDVKDLNFFESKDNFFNQVFKSIKMGISSILSQSITQVFRDGMGTGMSPHQGQGL